MLLKEYYQSTHRKLNEAANKIADIRKILKTKKGKRIDSIFMDVETAEKVMKHYKSLRGSAKEKFAKQKIQNIVKSVDESVNEVNKAQLKKMIKMAKKSGAKGYDIVKSIADDLGVSPDKVVSDMERYRWTNQTEDTDTEKPEESFVGKRGVAAEGSFRKIQKQWIKNNIL